MTTILFRFKYANDLFFSHEIHWPYRNFHVLLWIRNVENAHRTEVHHFFHFYSNFDSTILTWVWQITTYFHQEYSNFFVLNIFTIHFFFSIHNFIHCTYFKFCFSFKKKSASFFWFFLLKICHVRTRNRFFLLVFLLVCLLSHWSLCLCGATHRFRISVKTEENNNTSTTNTRTQTQHSFGTICFVLAALRYMRQYTQESPYTEIAWEKQRQHRRTERKTEHGGTI